MPIVSKTLASGTTVIEDPRGSVQMTRVRSGVLFLVCKGFFSKEFYEPMLAVARREIEAAGSLIFIVDGWELGSVDTAFREAWTEWFKAHRERLRIHLLAKSKLLLMAASLVNLFTTSVIKIYGDAASWERAVEAEVPGFRRKEAAQS